MLNDYGDYKPIGSLSANESDQLTCAEIVHGLAKIIVDLGMQGLPWDFRQNHDDRNLPTGGFYSLNREKYGAP